MISTRHAPWSGRGFTNNTRRLAVLLAMSVLAGATACGGGSDAATGPGKNKVAGLYALMTIDKKAIPREVYHGPFFDAAASHFYNQLIVTVTGGEVVLRDDGTFHIAVDLDVNGDGETETGTIAFGGTYDVHGSDVALAVNGGNGGSAALQDDYLTVDIDVLKGKGTLRKYFFRLTK